MKWLRGNLIVALGVAALAIPASVVAHPGENHGKGHGKGHGKTHGVAYVFKGTYEGESVVLVEHGNSRVRKGGFLKQTVAFDFTEAAIVASDVFPVGEPDGKRTLDDVQVGDKVLVKARLPRTEPGSQPFKAERLVDQTHH